MCHKPWHSDKVSVRGDTRRGVRVVDGEANSSRGVCFVCHEPRHSDKVSVRGDKHLGVGVVGGDTNNSLSVWFVAHEPWHRKRSDYLIVGCPQPPK